MYFLPGCWDFSRNQYSVVIEDLRIYEGDEECSRDKIFAEVICKKLLV